MFLQTRAISHRQKFKIAAVVIIKALFIFKPRHYICSILSILEFPYIPYYVISERYTVVCIICSRLLTVFKMAEKKIEPRRKKYFCINEE